MRSGCQWQWFPTTSTMVHSYHYFRLWRLKGSGMYKYCFADWLRIAAGRQPEPSAAVIDSQSVKTTERGECVVMMLAKGKGRKRHIGRCHGSTANVSPQRFQDRDGAKLVWKNLWKILSYELYGWWWLCWQTDWLDQEIAEDIGNRKAKHDVQGFKSFLTDG